MTTNPDLWPEGFSRRTVLLGGLAGLGALALSACGEESAPQSGAAQDATGAGTVSTGPDGVQEVTILVQDDYVFTPDAFTVSSGRVRLTLRSTAEQLTHNLRFTPGDGPAPIEEEIPILAPGDEDTIEFAADQPGDYGFECSFHVALGQVGTMTVTPA